MKRLFLVRHAKSDWSHVGLKDIHRSLNKRGYENADKMAKKLVDTKQKIDLIISSPAIRAISTSLIFAHILNYSREKIEIKEHGIYESSTNDFINTIFSIKNRCSSAMIVGHNPTITAVANKLCSINTQNIPTTGIVAIEFKCEKWAEIAKENGRLVFFDFPKNHL